MKVRGHFAVAREAPSGQTVLYDLAAKTSSVVTGNFTSFDFAANGVFAYGTNAQHVTLEQAGATTDLGPGTAPVTDGVDVAWTLDPSTINFRDGSGAITAIANATAPYLVAGGWAAFTRSLGGPSQVWVRSPAGVEIRIGQYAAAVLESLDEHGNVSLCFTGRRSVSFAAAAPIELSTCIGSLKWIAGHPQIAMSGSILQQATAREPPACIPGADELDAGAPDGGSEPPPKHLGCTSFQAAPALLGLAALWGLRRRR